MDCEQARDLLLDPRSTRPSSLMAHLRSCSSCWAEAERGRWLDGLLQPALVVEPPVAVASAARRAALPAAPAAFGSPVLTTRTASTPPLASPGATPGPSLAAYLLAGLLAAIAAGLLGGSLTPALSDPTAALLESLWLLLTLPLVSLAAPLAELEVPWASWAALIVLAWGLRLALTSSGPGQAALRSRSSAPSSQPS